MPTEESEGFCNDEEHTIADRRLSSSVDHWTTWREPSIYLVCRSRRLVLEHSLNHLLT